MIGLSLSPFALGFINDRAGISVGGGMTFGWLMEDGSSFWLMEDGTSEWLLESASKADVVAVYAWGDSTTAQGYPAVLQGLLHAGSVAYNYGVAGQHSSEIADRMVADTAHQDGVQVFWVGVNDSWDQPAIMTALARMVAASATTNYVIMQPWTGRNGYAPPAPPHMADLAAAITSAYPGHFFDVRLYAEANGDGSSGDNTDIANDTVPRSLQTDDIHPNSTGNTVIATGLKAFLISSGIL